MIRSEFVRQPGVVMLRCPILDEHASDNMHRKRGCQQKNPGTQRVFRG